MLKELFNEDTKITFKNRPVAVPYNYRVIYKISQIILILGTVCKRGGCSNVKLHMISNALSSNNILKELENVLDDKKDTIPIVRFEPAVTRALNFAIADEFIQIQSSNSKMKLTDKGKQLYKEILEDETLMVLEKQELNQIKDKLKEDVIDKIIEKWGANNVTN